MWKRTVCATKYLTCMLFVFPQDKDFGKGQPHRVHQNPTAEVSTTLHIYQRYSIDRAYLGDTFFWATIPNPGDVIVFKFNPQIKIAKYVMLLLYTFIQLNLFVT